MDAVYILGTGSKANDLEILYSVRSLTRHMLDLRAVYVVGEETPHLPGVINISASDTSKEKWKNAYHKTLKACSIEGISDNFLLMNDDFFMLDPFEGAEWPFYASNRGNGGPAGPLNFSVHCPIRINKEWYKNLPPAPLHIRQFSPRSFYCNFYKAPPTQTDDFVLRAGKGARPYDEQIAGWPCFSIGDGAMLDESFLDWIDSLYPEPSKFE